MRNKITLSATETGSEFGEYRPKMGIVVSLI